MSDWPIDGDETPPNFQAGDANSEDRSPQRRPHSARPAQPRRPKKGTTEVSPVLRNWQVLDSDSEAEVDTSAVPPAYTEYANSKYADSELFDGTGLEIEGEATLVESTTDTGRADVLQREPADALFPAEPVDLESDAVGMIADHQDPAIVVHLAERHQQVTPGEEVTYTLRILNNGTERADFRVTAEGWLDEAWLTTPIPQITLGVGEERTVQITLAPPRQSTTLAGDYALAFVVREFGVRATHYGQHMTRLGAMLTILPYTDLRLGRVQPALLQLTWWHRQTVIGLPVVNRGNHAATVRLHVRQPDTQWNCKITASSDLASPGVSVHGTPQQRRGKSSHATLVIAAGQTAKPTVSVHLRHHPFVALHKLQTTIQLVATTVPHGAYRQAPWVQTAAVNATAKPLLGIWHLTSLLGAIILTVMATGMAGLAALLIFSLRMQQPAPAQAAPQPIVAPPVIVAYIQAPVNSAPALPQSADNGTNAVIAPLISMGDVTQPGSTAATTEALPDVVVLPGPPPSSSTTTESGAPPIVYKEQVSAPGAVATPPSQTSPNVTAANGSSGMTAVAVPAATPAPLTYATMFREIAGRYALNWRILAAQAYVESGFDSVALGKHGDLGLMQVLPATWHEWAPTVAATDPFDSYSNVLVAAAYLNFLRDTLGKAGHPEPEWMLVAYNWGIDKVLQHLESGKGWDDLDAVRREYATEVLRLAETIPADG